MNRIEGSKEINRNELLYLSPPLAGGMNDIRERIDSNKDLGYDKETIYFVITKQFLSVLIKNKDAVGSLDY